MTTSITPIGNFRLPVAHIKPKVSQAVASAFSHIHSNCGLVSVMPDRNSGTLLTIRFNHLSAW